MKFPDFSSSSKISQWERFKELLWFDAELGIWLDISRMKINLADFVSLEPSLQKSYAAMSRLENGHISNQDEQRQVGHYWLRNPQISPQESIANLISEEVTNIETFTKKITKGELLTPNGQKFTDVIWIGIGGSGLGPLLIVEALQSKHSELDIHFVDNVDPWGISNLLSTLNDRLLTTLFVVVSKSGGTPEPRIGMEQCRDRFEKLGGSWAQHCVAITMKNSKLSKLAEKEQWLSTFDLPDWVGGRTSITSSVGLLMAGLCSCDIKQFLDGASKMDQLTRSTNTFNNPAALLALSWWISGEGKGKRDMVVLPYRDRLQIFSRYLQQLVMESLGKSNDRNGSLVNQGLSVFGNKGSTDQHAYVQQLRDGIDNFFVTFIEVLKEPNDIKQLNGEDPGSFLSGFFQGTRTALTEGNRQNLTITLKDIDELRLGALIALFERTVGIYGELINVNAYHQPGVEAGKQAASNILNLKSEIITLLSNSNSFSLYEIQDKLPIKDPDIIYHILRYECFSGDKLIAVGDWKSPDSLRFKIN